ncbi:toxin-antitoxin system, antitoxin component, ribbon-helix-helix domain protein [Oesophagostomum dentatum]|uniref:Toxin-antitoxin system, antitoxin component, ribbon-helix-helix domain protein n=1 Tax=Oesophagostomum dentatum TaxID=61180 RepID=A0A0B1TQK2_OESDE|nr:toxin-antitoxin system, antitoxin component, ribbon-helix-helix domain protein [Oesophagostomum dentatum]
MLRPIFSSPKSYPSWTIDDNGRFFIIPPALKQTSKTVRGKSLADLVPQTLYYSHPKEVAPPNPDLPMSIRDEAYFINRRIYGIE